MEIFFLIELSVGGCNNFLGTVLYSILTFRTRLEFFIRAEIFWDGQSQNSGSSSTLTSTTRNISSLVKHLTRFETLALNTFIKKKNQENLLHHGIWLNISLLQSILKFGYFVLYCFARDISFFFDWNCPVGYRYLTACAWC